MSAISANNAYKQPDPDIPIWALVPRLIITLWAILVFWGIFLILFPCFFVLLIQPKKFTQDLAHGILNRIWSFFTLYVGSFTRVVVINNASNLPNKPYIIAANHNSFLDIPVISLAVWRQLRFLGRIEFKKVPLFGWMYARLHVLINRKDSQQTAAAMEQVKKHLLEGTSIVIFPEGTTKHPLPIGNLKNGAFRLAIQTKIPILPVTIINSRNILDRNFILNPGTVKVIIDPPIETDNWSDEHLDEAKQSIYNLFEQNIKRYAS